MHITQSAYSLLIRQLEQRLGIAVFERTTRHVALSEAGLALLPIARRVLADLEEIHGRVVDLREGRRGTLRLAIVPSIACSLLPDVLAVFRRNMPFAKVELFEAQALPLIDHVEQGGSEFGISIRPQRETSLHFEKLLSDPLVAVVNASHPVAANACVSWHQLRDLPHISVTMQSGVWAHSMAAATAAGVNLQPALQTSSYFTAIGFVRAGLGYTVLSKLAMTGAALAGVAVLPLIEPQVEREIGAIVRPPAELSPVAQEFLRIFKETLAAQAPTAR